MLSDMGLSRDLNRPVRMRANRPVRGTVVVVDTAPESLDPETALAFLDEEGCEVALDAWEAHSLFMAMNGLESVTVSACPTCRSRTVSIRAFLEVVDLLVTHPRSRELRDLAEDAPTMHLFVEDRETECEHALWFDPGFDTWLEVAGYERDRVRH